MRRVDWGRQFTDPEYSAIKTWTTDTLDQMDGSRWRVVQWVGRVVGRVVPRDWGNWFS